MSCWMTGKKFFCREMDGGDHELRMAIADYLHQARGVNCVAEQIIIGAGNEYLELLLAQVLGGKEDRTDG